MSALKTAYPYFLANRAVMGTSFLDVTDKFTGAVATKVSLAQPDVIDQAIGAAVEAAPKMAAMPAYERKEVLEHLVRRLKERHEELSLALCAEAGKPIKDSRGEVDRAIITFQIAAEESVRVYGEYAPLDIAPRAKGYTSITRRFPIGPVSFISPFNFPINLAAHKIAPALAIGCPFVLKPASRTPIGALLIGEILSECPQLPAGAFSVLPCSRDGADLFTTDERLKLMSFTGSPDVGWALKAKAGKKKVVLELGGNAAVIIDKDADIDQAVSRCVVGGYYQSGQSCIGVQRILLHDSLYDAFAERFVKAVSQLVHGDPRKEETFVGPIISEGEAQRIERWVNDAVAGGARLLTGGTRDGAMIQAAVLSDVPTACDLFREEVFGPVCILERFGAFDEAVRMVNDSRFGLQAGIFTRDMRHAFYAFEHMEVGGVVINDVPSVRVDSQAYGGVKDSGFGREGIRYAMEDMSELKILLMKDIHTL